MGNQGLVLVWDLDQTIIGWSADTKTYVLNSLAIEVLRLAFQYHNDYSLNGTINRIVLLTNNSDPDVPVEEIEQNVGFKFDFVINRTNPLRDTTNPLVKDIATVRRIVGYDVDPKDVWIMDDMKHILVDEGAHWIHIKTQADNPSGSGFFKDPDETNYTTLLTAIKYYKQRNTRTRRARSGKFRKTTRRHRSYRR